MVERIKSILASKTTLLFCLSITACLPILLYSSAGNGTNYLSYWAAYSLSEFGEFLNYNGERAVLSSSWLYVAVLAFAHKLTNIPLSLLGGLAGILFALLAVYQVRRLGGLLSPATGGLAALLLALNPLFLYWAASGTEVTLVAWLVTGAIYTLVLLTQAKFSGRAFTAAALFLIGLQLAWPTGSLFVPVVLSGLWLFTFYRGRSQQSVDKVLSQRIILALLALLALSVLVAVLIAGWRGFYFGAGYPQTFAANPGALFKGVLVLLRQVTHQSGAALSLLLLAGSTAWVFVRMIRSPHEQPPLLWVTAVFSVSYLVLTLLTGGDWISGIYGEWFAHTQYFSLAAPLLALILAVLIGSLQTRRAQYLWGGVLVASLSFSTLKILANESTGVPVSVGMRYAEQVLPHQQAQGMTWFDVTNRVLARDITLLAALDESLANLEQTLDRPVRLMSRQAGMVMHHLAQSRFGAVVFNDLQGRSGAALADCPPSDKLRRHPVGLNLNYSDLFENWAGYAECIQRPDIIFDILIRPEQLQAIEENGYTVVYEQNGMLGYGDNRIPQHAFIAIDNNLVTTQDVSKVYRNEDYWRTEPARVFDLQQNTRFVVIGHGRGLLEEHADVLDEVVDLINQQRPQFVFVLGDFVRLSVDAEWDQLEKHVFARLDAPVIFVPGNHETRSNAAGDDSVYRRRAPAFPAVIKTPHVNFLQLNSSLRLPEVRQYLAGAYEQIDTSKPTILITHHKVWAAKTPVTRHMTTYTRQQFLPLLDGRIDAIIAGDGAGEFIVETTTTGVPAYMTGIGMKGRGKPIFFAIGNIDADGQLDLRPFDVSINPYNPRYTTLEPKPTLPDLLKNAPPIGID
jgi:hypothetical protein